MLKPTLRTKYRYVSFIIVGENVKDVEKLVYHEIVKLVGVFGTSEMGITVSSKNDNYFIRVERKYIDTLKGIVPLINSLGKYSARPKIIKTSGTIKKITK